MILQASCERLPIAANSVDMIFADPPYVAEYFHTYRWLATEAARVLKPGCFVAAMCGSVRLNKLMRWFDDAGLGFYHLFSMVMSGAGSGCVWKRTGSGNMPIALREKHILAYYKPGALPCQRAAMTSTYYPGAADKYYHHWGQSVDSHRYYIDCLSAPGDLVLDPFCGGGTTAAACELIGRRWICADIDPEAIDITARRMAGWGGEMRPLPMFDQVGQ